MFRGPGSQSLHIINGPRVYIDRGNTWETPRRHHHDVYLHISLGVAAQLSVWITWRFVFIPAVLCSVWTTNGGELTNRRCGVNAASLCERGYSQPPQVLPLPVWDNTNYSCRRLRWLRRRIVPALKLSDVCLSVCLSDRQDKQDWIKPYIFQVVLHRCESFFSCPSLQYFRYSVDFF